MRHIDEILPSVLVIACALSVRFIESGSVIFLVFIATLAVYVWRKYDARILVGIAILLLLGSAILLANGMGDYADKMAVLAYYFLVTGAFGLLITDLRKKKVTPKKIKRKMKG